MSAAINYFVKELSQQKNINGLEAITRSKEKYNLPLVNQPSSLHYWLLELRFGFTHQPVTSEQKDLVSPFFRAPFRKPLCQDGYQRYYGQKKLNLFSPWQVLAEPACYLHLILQHKMLNKKIVKIIDITLTVKNTNTGSTDTTTKNFQLMLRTLLI